MEVKFEDERNIYSFVTAVVRRGLTMHDLTPAVMFEGEAGSRGDTSSLRFIRPERKSFGEFNVEANRSSERSDTGELRFNPAKAGQTESGEQKRDSDFNLDMLFGKSSEAAAQIDSASGTARGTEIHHIVESKQSSEADSGSEASEGVSVAGSKGIWQLHNKYILLQIQTGMMLVDQHVAHERILYEKALTSFEANLPFSQQLLFPHTVELSAGDFALVKELLSHLEKLGFNLKLFGKNTVVIEGVPSDVKLGSEAKILQEVMDEFKQYETVSEQPLDVRDKLAKSFSCRAAVKAGDKLTVAEMASLIDQLFATSMPYVCPHGRPVVIKISTEELDRRFGRT
jgi:DNA mismatch repair protein MutL